MKSWMRLKYEFIFKIIKFENEDDFIKDPHLDLKNSLFISKSNQKLLLNENLSQKNFLSFDSLPLTFNKLTEIININLIKLRFNYQSKINIKGYELNLNSKFFTIEFFEFKTNRKRNSNNTIFE